MKWQPDFVDRVSGGQQPTRSGLHDEGAFYSLDFSSVFAAVPFLTAVEREPNLIVDLCASPGGKSILAWRGLRPRLLVCNEVIGHRLGALVSNLKRCAIRPALVLSADVSRLAEAYASAASLVVVDAPCSGQSLRAKGKFPPGAFHPATVNMNANRQRRIIANAARMAAPAGFLSYMTCTFSREENEGVMEWFLKKFPYFRPVDVPDLSQFRSALTEKTCYRLWPQQGLGAGAFSCLLQNGNEGEPGQFRLDQAHVRWSS